MSRRSEIVPCVDCQGMFSRSLLNRSGRCLECARVVMRDVPIQLHNHEGPYYERWKEACIRRAERYAEGIKGG